MISSQNPPLAPSLRKQTKILTKPSLLIIIIIVIRYYHHYDYYGRLSSTLIEIPRKTVVKSVGVRFQFAFTIRNYFTFSHKTSLLFSSSLHWLTAVFLQIFCFSFFTGWPLAEKWGGPRARQVAWTVVARTAAVCKIISSPAAGVHLPFCILCFCICAFKLFCIFAYLLFVACFIVLHFYLFVCLLFCDSIQNH